MTTQDFITKNYGVKRTGYKQRHCASVIADANGNIYSYGYHYPLLFKVKGLDFVNIQGYSSTTSKHICYAWRAVDYKAIGVKLWKTEVEIINSNFTTDDEKINAVLVALTREYKAIKDLMESKKRKDTIIYKNLESILNSLSDSYNKIVLYHE